MDKLIDLLPELGEATFETLYIVVREPLLRRDRRSLPSGSGLYTTRSGCHPAKSGGLHASSTWS